MAQRRLQGVALTLCDAVHASPACALSAPRLRGAPDRAFTDAVSAPARTALLLGATGLVGRACLARLLEEPRYARVIAPVRRSALAAHPKLEERVVDFGSPPTFEPIDDVYCAIGTTMKKAGSRAAFREVDLAIPLRLAERALAAGARRFALVSSVGADARASSFYLATKGELEDALAALGFESLLLFRPSLLVGEREENRTGERIGIAVARVIAGGMVGPLRRYRPIEADTVASAMIAALADDAPEGKVVYEHDRIVELAR